MIQVTANRCRLAKAPVSGTGDLRFGSLRSPGLMGVATTPETEVEQHWREPLERRLESCCNDVDAVHGGRAGAEMISLSVAYSAFP